MADHVETLNDIRNEYAAYNNAHHQLAALDAAIAALSQPVAEAVEYRECGFLIDGPSETAFVLRREIIEDKIKGLCFENGDDPDDYTASQLYLRLASSGLRGTGEGG